MTRFVGYANRRYGLDITGYHELYKWSIENITKVPGRRAGAFCG